MSTSREAQLDLRKVTTPVLLHLLRGKIRFPLLFLLWCRLTVGGFRKRIDPDFPPELVELTVLLLWVYINLKARIGQSEAFEIMRIAVLTGGVASWNIAYGAAEKPRTFENLIAAELEVSQKGFTRWNTLELVSRSERRFELRVTRCRYHELTTSVGVPELTLVVCQIDNAAFNSYLPDEVEFTRGGPGHRIADGAHACDFIWERKVVPILID